jgi:hypothetical protein
VERSLEYIVIKKLSKVNNSPNLITLVPNRKTILGRLFKVLKVFFSRRVLATWYKNGARQFQGASLHQEILPTEVCERSYILIGSSNLPRSQPFTSIFS